MRKQDDYNNILEAVGHTPMVRLNRMNDPDPLKCW